MFPVFSISEQTPEQISVKLFQATEEPSTCDLPKNVSWPEIMIHYYSNRELRSSWSWKVIVFLLLQPLSLFVYTTFTLAT
mgnify:CR=1 FL=1